LVERKKRGALRKDVIDLCPSRLTVGGGPPLRAPRERVGSLRRVLALRVGGSGVEKCVVSKEEGGRVGRGGNHLETLRKGGRQVQQKKTLTPAPAENRLKRRPRPEVLHTVNITQRFIKESVLRRREREKLCLTLFDPKKGTEDLFWELDARAVHVGGKVREERRWDLSSCAISGPPASRGSQDREGRNELGQSSVACYGKASVAQRKTTGKGQNSLPLG